MGKLHALVRQIGLFWAGVTYVYLILMVWNSWMTVPIVRQFPLSLWLWGNVVAFALVNWFGFHLLMQQRQTIPSQRYLLHFSIFWLLMMILVTDLARIAAPFAGLYWTVFGVTVALTRIPWNIPFACFPIVGMVLFWQILPTSGSWQDWFNFVYFVVAIVVYAIVGILIAALIGQRFAREKILQQLKVANDQLYAAHTQLERTNSQERQLAILHERERMAREMHDTVGHALVLATVKLEAMKRLQQSDPERVGHELDVTMGVLRTAMGELRSTLALLRTPMDAPKAVGVELTRAVQAAAERTGWQIDLQIQTDTDDWPAAVCHALLRIGREAITNAERHAQAQKLHVCLARAQHMAHLTIVDDGRGLPVDPSGEEVIREGHYGIQGMRERAKQLQGSCTVRPAQPCGTLVECCIPLAAQETIDQISALQVTAYE